MWLLRIRDKKGLWQRGTALNTVFDWITLAIFAGLITLFLQRSTEEEPRDNLFQYLGAAVGCAVANYLGNEVSPIAAVVVIAAVLGYIIFVLKPFQDLKKD